MTVPATTLSRGDDGPEPRASAGELLELASGEDLARWEQQLAAAGNCANPILLRGRVDAVDRTTGGRASLYDTGSEPGGVLRLPRAATAARTSARPAPRCTRATPDHPGRAPRPGRPAPRSSPRRSARPPRDNRRQMDAPSRRRLVPLRRRASPRSSPPGITNTSRTPARRLRNPAWLVNRSLPVRSSVCRRVSPDNPGPCTRLYHDADLYVDERPATRPDRS
jgi:hypothetical protein